MSSDSFDRCVMNFVDTLGNEFESCATFKWQYLKEIRLGTLKFIEGRYDDYSENTSFLYIPRNWCLI